MTFCSVRAPSNFVVREGVFDSLSIHEYGAHGWGKKAKNALCQPALIIFAADILDVGGQSGKGGRN